MNRKYEAVLDRIPELRTAAEYALGRAEKNDTFTRTAAYVVAPVLFCYVDFILSEAKKQGIKRIYFLARDGYIMNIIAREMCLHGGYDIDCRYLYCSRYSLKNALYYLCDTPEKAEESGIFGRCARQSASNTLLRGGFDKEQRKEIYRDIGFEGSEEKQMTDAEHYDFCGRLKKSEVFFRLLRENSAEKYEVIQEYFRQEGLFEDLPYALADSGWLGSIQSAFERLTEDRRATDRVQGFYFGLFRRLEKGRYRSFLFSGEDAHKVVPRFCNNLFECFCSAPHGMTVGYKREDGRILPVTGKVKERSVELAEIQCAVARDFAVNCAVHAGKIDTDRARVVCKKLLFALMYKPAADEVKALSEFMFCDDSTEKILEPLAEKCEKDSLKSLLIWRRIINRIRGRQIYPDKGLYWLYGTIELSDVRFKGVYRLSVRCWEKLRLLREKRTICR